MSTIVSASPQSYPCPDCGAEADATCVYMPAAAETVEVRSEEVRERQARTGMPCRRSHNGRYAAMRKAIGNMAAAQAERARINRSQVRKLRRQPEPGDVLCRDCGADPGSTCIYISPTDRDGGKSAVHQLGQPTERFHNGRHLAVREEMQRRRLKRRDRMLREFFERFGGIFEEGRSNGLEA